MDLGLQPAARRTKRHSVRCACRAHFTSWRQAFPARTPLAEWHKQHDFLAASNSPPRRQHTRRTVLSPRVNARRVDTMPAFLLTPTDALREATSSEACHTLGKQYRKVSGGSANTPS
ncbi:hypothetical protein TRVL_08832 [Trypanosoma vivax]|nr:hypothetical protein TRVL_08832 [Trypanosoma vivax]